MQVMDEEKFDELSWELQLMATKVARFMENNSLDCLTVSAGNGWTMVLQSNKRTRTPQNDHGMDERKASHGT